MNTETYLNIEKVFTPLLYERNMSWAYLAERSGVSRHTMYHMKKTNEVRFSVLIRMTKALNITLNDILPADLYADY